MADESKRMREFLENTKKSVEMTNDLSDAIKKANEEIESFYKTEVKRAEASKKLNKELTAFYKASDFTDFISILFEKFAELTKKFPLNKFFKNEKIDASVSNFKKKSTEIFTQQNLGQRGVISSYGAVGKAGVNAFIGIGKAALTATTIATAGIGALIAAITLSLKKIADLVIGVDKASAQLVKTTGILDASLSTTLIRATENAELLGGNIERAGEFAASLVSNLSPAISLTGALVGNVAQVGERFGLSVDNAGKLTQIVSELTNTTFEQASGQVEGIVDGLGRLGPAVARNLAESYDSVIDSFGIGLESLVEQTRQATRLGISLSKAADISEKLLDFQSSISAEFKASALLGQQINFQKARQLAFEGDIVGATNEVLDQVEQLGGLEQLTTFQRKALAEAAGISVSELQKELNLRRQIGSQDRITQATRDSALGKIEELQRRLQGQLFKILASPEVQKAFETVLTKINKFVEGDGLNNLANKLGDVVDGLGRAANTLIEVLTGERRITLGRALRGKGFTKEVNDAVITPQGEVVKTNPRDFIIATQNPQQLTSGGNDVMMAEMVSLLRDLKQNGVRSEVNLDGKKVSKQLATSNRY